MTIQVLITGRLVSTPEQRTGPSGKGYVLAKLAMHQDAEVGVVYITVFAFSAEVQAVFLALGQGAEVVVSGVAKVSTWTNREGQAMPQMSVTASAVLTLHEAKRVDKHVAHARHQARERHGNTTAKAQRAMAETREQWQGDGLDDGHPLDF